MNTAQLIDIAFRECYEYQNGKIVVSFKLVRIYKTIFPKYAFTDDEIIKSRIRQLLCDAGWNK